MAEEIAFENGQISNFQGLVTLTLTLDESYCIPLCMSYRPLPACQISLKLKKLFVNERSYTRTEGPCQVQSHATQKLG